MTRGNVVEHSKMRYFLVKLVVFLSLLLSAEARFCGRPRVCHCLEGLNKVNCINKELFKVPTFENEGVYDILDLRKNHIKSLDSEEILTKFSVIDIRQNKEFDCEQFNEKFKNIVIPIIMSDCGNNDDDTDMNPSGYTTYLPGDEKTTSDDDDRFDGAEKTVSSNMDKVTQSLLDVTEMLSQISLSTDYFISNISNIWTMPASGWRFNKFNTIYVVYGCSAVLMMTIIFIIVWCRKKIVRRCRNENTHHILDEESAEEETMFQLTSHISPPRGVKQE